MSRRTKATRRRSTTTQVRGMKIVRPATRDPDPSGPSINNYRPKTVRLTPAELAYHHGIDVTIGE